METIPYVAVGVALLALAVAAVLAAEVRRGSAGGTRQVELMGIIRSGALTFTRRELMWTALVVGVVAVLLWPGCWRGQS